MERSTCLGLDERALSLNIRMHGIKKMELATLTRILTHALLDHYPTVQTVPPDINHLLYPLAVR